MLLDYFCISFTWKQREKDTTSNGQTDYHSMCMSIKVKCKQETKGLEIVQR
jgi:hypothetical protein